MASLALYNSKQVRRRARDLFLPMHIEADNLLGEYMIVVTNQECVGNLRGYHIYRATTFQILPLPRDLNTLSDAQIDDEQKFMHLLQDHLRQNSFYYSYGYDLTQSLQRQADMQREDLRLPMWQTASRSCKKKLIVYAPTNNLVKGRSTFLLEQGTV